MYWPPLMESVDPVMKPASSAARNKTARAISSGLPSRPTGICGRIFFSMIQRHGIQHLGVDIAGTNGVDRHAEARRFQRQRFGESEFARFGRGIVCLAELAL